MKIQETIEGEFLYRKNRFLVFVDVSGRETPCHLPNPGRLRELLVPGVKMLLKKKNKKGRKTEYDLIGVYHDNILVFIDSRIPNRLFLESYSSIENFSTYEKIYPEFMYARRRFDFLLVNDESCLVEVKSCTLVDHGVALFPDAPTKRGREHLKALMDAVNYKRAIVFIVLRPDAFKFKPNDKIDPDFGKTLRKAIKNGVDVRAYICDTKREEIRIKEEIPVISSLS
ncbi:MAG: DNA/RNA nuclease SfsA [Candidatus Syntropharchaeia archaeon]